MAAGSRIEITNFNTLVIQTYVILRFMGLSVRKIHLWHCFHDWKSRSHPKVKVEVENYQNRSFTDLEMHPSTI